MQAIVIVQQALNAFPWQAIHQVTKNKIIHLISEAVNIIKIFRRTNQNNKCGFCYNYRIAGNIARRI